MYVQYSNDVHAMCCDVLRAIGPPALIRVQSAESMRCVSVPVPVSRPRPGSQSCQIFAVPFINRSWDSLCPRPMTGGQNPGRTKQLHGTRARRQPKERASQAMDQMSGFCSCILPAASGIGWVGRSWIGWAGQNSSNPPAGGCAGDGAGMCAPGGRYVRTLTVGPTSIQRLRSSGSPGRPLATVEEAPPKARNGKVGWGLRCEAGAAGGTNLGNLQSLHPHHTRNRTFPALQYRTYMHCCRYIARTRASTVRDPDSHEASLVWLANLGAGLGQRNSSCC